MIKKAFGNRIRSLRNQMNISQEKFALIIGMDRTYYTSVENGKRNIALENILKIAKGFKIKLEELFENIDSDI